MVQILEKIERGDGELSDLELLESINGRILGKVLCALGEFAVYPVSSYISKWREEFVAHIQQGRCPYDGTIVDRGDPRAQRPAPRAGARREPARGDRVSAELVTITVDDVELQVPKGTGLVEAALAAGIEIPVFCYEPRLGPPVGACRMCLCEVQPGPPKPQAACTLTAADGMVVKTAATSRDGARGAGRDARVHPRQPPARLSRLRQGRRVPAPGPHLPLRPRQHAHDLREADVREADPDLADDRARP